MLRLSLLLFALLAAERRPGGVPPLRIDSDGTVF